MRQLKTAIDEQVETNAEHLLRENAALAEQLKLSEALVIALAYEYAEGTPTEFDAAMAGLRNALQVAADARAKGRLPSNVDDALTEIIARVDALNDAGEVEAATAALQEEEERASAGLARLYDKGLAQAVLTRDVDLAVSYEVKRVSLETPDPAALYGALDTIRRQRRDMGRDKGLAFDLEVAIALGDTLYNCATTDEELGMALGNKAVALRILGERLQSPGPLAAAVETFEKLLTVFTRDEFPRLWATAQNNLGNTLGTLGKRQDDLDALIRAIAAYEAALEVRTRDALPLDWATTQNNLGNALSILGERQDDPDALTRAIAAYEAALEVRTRDTLPLDWAMTQNNLGNALQTLGARQDDPDALTRAITAYEAALEVHTRDTLPFDWAMTQNNLGNAMQTLGAQEDDPDALARAIAAYEAALEVRTRDALPLDWAMTTENVSNAQRSQARLLSGDTARRALEAALLHVEHALTVYSPENTPYNHGEATRLRDGILADLDALP
ncbi:tetratricopeptide repeat protein [Dinoroseobacter sp. S375]|uniref:tetratricopeptide repeat protein n=1 Tax=Dinoroseobacter sp. S375 TaxID=3415136 RepID=UPI003C7B6A2F